MRRWCAMTLLTCLVLSSATLADDQLSSDQLRRMYDDAVAQMRTAQDRRNELARENEQMRAKLEKLERAAKELADTQTQLTALADATYRARVESAALSEFMEAHPAVNVQWREFLRKNDIAAPDPAQYIDANWPISSKH